MAQPVVPFDVGLATLIAAIVAAIVSIIGVVISIVSNIRIEHVKAQLSQQQEISQERRQFWMKQVSEFYDPIFTLLSVNGQIFKRIGPNSSIRHSQEFDEEQTARVWNELVNSVVIPNNIKICEIIKTKLHLLNVTDNAVLYIDFITHAQAYKVFRDQPYESYRRFTFPKGFENHVCEQRKIVISQISAFLEERIRG